MAKVRVTINARPGYDGLGINGNYYLRGTTITVDESQLTGEYEVYRDWLTIEPVDAPEPTAEPEPEPRPKKRSR